MKKVFIIVSLLIFASISWTQQGEVILPFDGEIPIDSLVASSMNEDSYLNLDYRYIAGCEGDSALYVDTKLYASEGWGGVNIFTISREVGDFWDFSAYDTLSFRYYIERPPVNNDFNFILLFYDNTLAGWKAGDDHENWEYRNFDVITTDAVPGWNVVNVPLKEREGGGYMMEGSKYGLGAPYYDGGENNGKFDKDKITQLGFDFQFEQSGITDSSAFYLDHVMLKGESEISVIFFNGKALPSNVSMWNDYGGGTMITDEEYFAPPESKSVKWTAQGEWDAVIFDLESSKNLGLRWDDDSVQFKMKSEAGIGDLALVFYDTDTDSSEKNDYAFEAGYTITEAEMGYDGTWKEVKVALNDFDRWCGVWDGDIEDMVNGEMDSTKIKGFKIVANGQSEIVDKSMYFDQIWTGNPVIDITAPEAPELNVSAATYYNLLSWTDVEGETGETYDLYYGENEITDLSSSDVTQVRLGVGEGLETFTHNLRAPKNDASVTYYYAVVCKDAAGNASEISVIEGSVTNTAKGVPVISLTTPQNLVCDGDLSEWYDANIVPFDFAPSTNTPGHPGTETCEFDDDSDMRVRGYFAIDNDYLYVAFDTDDDAFMFDSTAGEWINDNVELFIGLYDWRGLKHGGFLDGAEPDYAVGFYPSNHPNHGLRIAGEQVMNTDSTYYYFDESPTGWIVESRIPLDVFVEVDPTDSRFHPKEGMRVAMDMSAHDSDVKGEMDGVLGYSVYNDDDSYQYPTEWTYTWIGEKFETGLGENVVDKSYRFKLSQNYPNPFNPVTTIPYTLENTGKVKLSIFNMLGQEIKVLVDKVQSVGTYIVQWDGVDNAGKKVASGIYIYCLQTEKNTFQRKLLLLR